jgi:hypothetical protein
VKFTIEVGEASVAALADALAARLRDVLRPPADGDGVRYVTRAQARAMGVEMRALLRAERAGELEAFKPGRVVVYRPADVLALVERAKVEQPAAREGAEVPPLDPFERAMARADRRRAR